MVAQTKQLKSLVLFLGEMLPSLPSSTSTLMAMLPCRRQVRLATPRKAV